MCKTIVRSALPFFFFFFFFLFWHGIPAMSKHRRDVKNTSVIVPTIQNPNCVTAQMNVCKVTVNTKSQARFAVYCL